MNKFRVWDKISNMYLGNDSLFIIANCTKFSPLDMSIEMPHGVVDPYKKSDGSKFDIILERSLGLKDENGEEVYEGDIFKSKLYPFYSDGDYNYNGAIGCDFEGWFYEVYPTTERVRGCACDGTMSDLILNSKGEKHLRIEVIGAIRKNPKLLIRKDGE